MKRLRLFLSALSPGARLQMLSVAIILGWWIWLDVKLGYWPIGIGIIPITWVIGWLMKPVMVANPRMTVAVLKTIRLTILLLYFLIFILETLLAWRQRWWHLLIAHFAREFFLWLDLSCEFWFLSELRLRQERQNEQAVVEKVDRNRIDHGDRFDYRNDDFEDEPRSTTRAKK